MKKFAAACISLTALSACAFGGGSDARLGPQTVSPTGYTYTTQAGVPTVSTGCTTTVTQPQCPYVSSGQHANIVVPTGGYHGPNDGSRPYVGQ